jgi:hypothetical protein
MTRSSRSLASREISCPYLTRQMSKWFYDTFTGAARCGSFAGKVFSLFGCSLWMNAVDKMIYVVRAA